MANEVLIKTGTPIILANLGDHSPAAANNLGTRTDQLNLTSVGINAYRQSDKVDFGVVRASLWAIFAALEFASAPTAGGQVLLYLAPSASATAGTGNPGNVSGADSAYTGYSSNPATSIVQLGFPVGLFMVTAQATTTVQIARCGVFAPLERYGSLVVHNDTDQALVGDAVEMSIRLAPVVDEIQ